MDQERNLGVTEARFGLTIVICMLAAIGFFVLLRLGNSGETVAVEVRPPETQGSFQQQQPVADDQPVVIQVEPEPRIARQNDLLQATYSDGAGGTPGNPAPATVPTDFRR